jgi:hypothetical protein
MRQLGQRQSGRPPLNGTLVLAGSLFVATLCCGIALVWLIDADSSPGIGLVLVPLVAVGALVTASYAEATPSSRATRTTELGNTARLLSLLAVLLVVPSVLIAFTDDEQLGGARPLDDACPPDRVPAGAFDDVPATATHARAIDCLAWWGMFANREGEFRSPEVLTRGQAAILLDELATVTGAALEDFPTGTFTDVDDPAQAEAAARLSNAQIMGGTQEATFSPALDVNRAQVATLLMRMYGHITDGGEPPTINEDVAYSDIVSGPHRDNILLAAGAGIVTGVGDTFDPGDPVTRGQLATMIARALDALVAEGDATVPDG